jgi:hypothetical protein
MAGLMDGLLDSFVRYAHVVRFVFRHLVYERVMQIG